MSKQVFVGAQQWEGYQVLCRPLEMLGVDRRLFGILMIIFMIFWQGMGSFFLAIGVSYGIYYLFRRMTKTDPQFFSVLRGSSSLPAAWYDPADAPSVYGAYIVPTRKFLNNLERSKRDALRARTVSGRQGRFWELASLVLGERGTR